MPEWQTATVSAKYHDAIVCWQQKNFPDLGILERHWDDYFKGQAPFRLIVKIGGLKSETIPVGQFAGRQRFERARDMVGNMFFSSRDIIRAQTSTELASIQQHRLSLDAAISDRAKFWVLRIMAEELRHAYQMFWVLEHDATWKKPGLGDVASQTIDELLSMQLGNHVLDAFNIDFFDFLCNAVFAAVIDLVGKYQLEMQQVFSYAPMARSMGPMLQEESFHLGSGRTLLKEIAVMSAQGRGDYTIADIQKSLNMWYPRGLEMFGNEGGGQTAIAFGFKDRTNGTAQAQYMNDVEEIVESVNIAIVQARIPGINRDEARALAGRLPRDSETSRGLSPDDLLFVPDEKFLRKRGADGIIFKPYSPSGEMLAEGGQPLSADRYLGYLATVLPASYLSSREFGKYAAELKQASHLLSRETGPAVGLNGQAST